MDPVKRHRVLGWLYLLGPVGTLVLFGLGTWAVSATGTWGALTHWIPHPLSGRNSGPYGVDAAIGWFVLTLGCSVGTAFELSRRHEIYGGKRVFYVVMLSPVVAAAHLCLVAGIVYVGCVAMLSSKPW